MAHKFTPRKNTNRQGPPEPPAAPPPGPADAPRKQSLRKSIRRLDGGAPPPKPKRSSGGGASPVRILVGLIVVACIGVAAFAAYQVMMGSVQGFKPNATVAGPTRLDWVFAESHKSDAAEKAMYKAFPSNNVQYEFYAPPNYDSQKAYPLIIFLSADPLAPAGWTTFRKLCVDRGILFAAPRAVGENHQTWERLRIVADVLDDVRKNYHVDTDRTYIGGVGSGARMACRTAFALPELFGGVIAIDGADLPYPDVFGQQRVSERLSVAMGIPDGSPLKAKLEQLYAAYFKETKTRTNVWNYPGQAGELPPAKVAEEMLGWLDEGASARRELAEKYKSSRISGDSDPPTKEQYAELFVKDAQKRLQDDPNTRVGVALLDGATNRWGNTPAATQATAALQQYVAGAAGRSIPGDVEAEKRPFEMAQARAIEAYLKGLAPEALEKSWEKDPVEDAKSGKELRDQAVFVWNVVKKSKAPPDLIKEADLRLAELNKLGPAKK